MSGSNYIWVVVGDASGLPVYCSVNKYMIIGWLVSRKNNRMLRVFRLRENQYPSRMEVCVSCLLTYPNQPAKERGHGNLPG